MGENYKNDLEGNTTPNKQTLADRFFKRFVENEQQIKFTNEDTIKEIRNLEKNLKKYDVLEIVLDCCSEEIISDYIANTLTTFEDFIDCFIFTDALGERLGRYLKGDQLNIYNSAEQYWHLIVREDSLKDEYVKCMEDSLIEQIREYGSYRNYLKNVKPEEKCASCGEELRENEGYYSRGDNVYCLLCKTELKWCKSCATYVRSSDFDHDIMCRYCENPDYTRSSEDSIRSELEPDFDIFFKELDILREREMIRKYENDLLAEKSYKDEDLAKVYETIKSYSEKDLANIYNELNKEEEEEKDLIKKYENDVLAEKPYDDYDLAELYEKIKPYNEKDLTNIYFTVNMRCPICYEKKELTFPKSVITGARQLTTISIPKGLLCDHHFQAYVDKNFMVRGYQKVDFEL
jgi:hypothetical protein